MLDDNVALKFEQGYLSPFFITDQEKKDCILENPYILIYEKKISSGAFLLSILEKVARTEKPLFILRGLKPHPLVAVR